MILLPVRAHVRNGRPVRAGVRMVADALRFAAERHKGQTRSDGVTPYIEHPARAVRVLREAGYPHQVQAAAALHDTVEDTNTTNQELVDRFGPEIAALVAHVTDPPGIADSQRRLSQLEHAASMPPEAQAVKLADRIANLHDTIHNPPDWSAQKLSRYYDHSEALAERCAAAHPGLAAKVRELAKQGRERLQA